MQCPNCNKPNEDGALFCGNCGKPLAPLYGKGNAATEISHDPALQGNGHWGNPPDRFIQGPPSPMPLSPQSNPSSRFPQPNPPSTFPVQSNPLSPFPPGNARTYEQAPSGVPTAPHRSGSNQQPIYDARTVSQPGPNSNPFYDTPSVTPGPLAPPSRPPTRTRTKGLAFLSIVVVICLVGILAGVITLLQGWGGKQTGAPGNNGSTAQATALFTDDANGGNTDTIEIDASGLAAPTAGTRYVVWLIDESENENVQALGTLSTPDHPKTPGQMVLKTTKAGTNLLGAGNEILVTRETGKVNLPTVSNTVLSARFPAEAFVHIRHLLVKYDPAPNQVSLLVGLLQQAKLLDQQGQNLKNNPNNKTIVQCSLYNMLALIEGSSAVQNMQPPPSCKTVGDGLGLLGPQGNRGPDGYSEQSYAGLANAHAKLAATRKDSTETIRQHAGHVEIAMDNLGDWLGTVDQDVQSLLKNSSDTGKIAEVARLTDIALHGTDANDDGTIQAIRGEAGAETAYEHGQLMATLSLTAGSGAQK